MKHTVPDLIGMFLFPKIPSLDHRYWGQSFGLHWPA
jgi:hypothetical protein